MAECPACGGEGAELGTIGHLEHFRCRACGVCFCRLAAQYVADNAHTEDPKGQYTIETGKGEKGHYNLRYSTNIPGVAWMLYRGINLGDDYKKRMQCDGRTIARATGWQGDVTYTVKERRA